MDCISGEKTRCRNDEPCELQYVRRNCHHRRGRVCVASSDHWTKALQRQETGEVFQPVDHGQNVKYDFDEGYHTFGRLDKDSLLEGMSLTLVR